MASPELNYLTEVLGVRELLGEGLVTAPRGLQVFVGAGLSADQQSLLERMLSAIQVSQFRLADEFPNGGVGLIFGEPGLLAWQRAGGDTVQAYKPGQMIEANGGRWLMTHALTELLPPTPAAEIQARKKSAWEHLKTLQRILAHD